MVGSGVAAGDVPTLFRKAGPAPYRQTRPSESYLLTLVAFGNNMTILNKKLK